MLIDAESAKSARGSAQGFIVMAEGNGINESIGCEFATKDQALVFLSSFEGNKDVLAEYMPDSDFQSVTRLYID